MIAYLSIIVETSASCFFDTETRKAFLPSQVKLNNFIIKEEEEEEKEEEEEGEEEEE